MTQESQDAASPEDLDQLASQVSASKPAVWEQSPIPVREQTRTLIAVVLAVGYVVLIAGIIIYVLIGKTSQSDSKDLMTLLITTYTTLLGSAPGYYFGRQEN